MLANKATLSLLVACFLSLVSNVAYAQYGKNNVRYDQLDQFYQSPRFDVWHNLDSNDPVQMEYLRQVVHNLENARDWIGSSKIFNHNIEKRIPIFFFKTHHDMENSNFVGGFMPEGVGAFAESERRRMVLKADFSVPLSRAIGVHELVHEFQFDVYNPSLIQKVVGVARLPGGYYEGCAEFLAGLYDPHTRDDIRRREQRTFASNPKSLPTWEGLHGDRYNPYTMWSMIPEFLEDKFSAGVAFCTQPLKKKIGLGEFIYDATKGELGNPDLNSEKFDQRVRHYWGTELGFELDRIERPKPYEENYNFKGRSITPYGHPYPMRSPLLSPKGDEMAAFTIAKYGPALMKYSIPHEGVYVSKEDREKIKNEKVIEQFSGMNLFKNLTPQLPPVPWEYLVIQGFETWPFNGFDAAWSHDGKKIAFFARINRDHTLVIIDAETGNVLRKIELSVDQAFSPSFGDEDQWIYFSAAENITRDIYGVNIGDPKVIQVVKLTNDERFDTAPAVSPDGSNIVYVGSDGDFQHLFMLDRALGTIKQLTFGQFNDSSPSWSDDGSTIVYTSDESDKIWNLYTLELATLTVSQWTEFGGGVETPLFARNDVSMVYCVVFHDDDQYHDLIYPNYELFEIKLKKPIRQYIAEDKKESNAAIFNPYRDLFKIQLDPNQLINPTKPSENWGCSGGGASIGVNTYWGAFGQSYLKCSNILETKHHLVQFAMGSSLRIFDYSYLKSEKRTTWLWGAHHYQLPFYYQFYDIAKRFPKQNIINNTWINETSLDLYTQYPLNKFNRWELFSRLRRRSFNVFGFGVKNFNESVFELNPESFNEQDIQMYRFLKESNNSNLSFGAAYVRDTVLYSNNTWGPFHGNAFRAQVEFAPPLGNEFKGYTSVNVSARAYRHLGSSSLFAARAELIATSRPNGDFILLCGPDRLRGCEYGSYAGNNVGYTSAELRFPLLMTSLGDIRGFLFGDAAFIRFSNDLMTAQKIKTYGFGLQYVIPFIGLPAQSIWTRDNGKWKPTFYVTLHW